jgi:uncharacterized protein YndB with AHSA1/START domain
MDAKEKAIISVQAEIAAPIDLVWKLWTSPEDIVKWNNASADWHTTRAENDLQLGGRFTYRMEARDGSMGFDFAGVYTRVIRHELIECTLDDDRKMRVVFFALDHKTQIVESFEAETENSEELQRGGWQAILDNFRKYAETIKLEHS